MKANTHHLRQILALERRYVIPTFQRDFEWTRAGQWELLSSDLEDTAERLVEARAHATATGKDIVAAEKGCHRTSSGRSPVTSCPPASAGWTCVPSSTANSG